ncbi:MAG TPA: DsbA family protein [Rhizomicrobium sp.]|nr:DsbA family protein [Rhizomicrobium sp.]
MTANPGLVGLVLAAAFFIAPALSAGLPDMPTAPDEIVAMASGALWDHPGSPVMGNPRGNVVVVEFFDYNCPYCRAVEPRLEALLKSDHGVKLVLKEFPILTPQSRLATNAAFAAARQGKYAPFHNALMNYHGMVDETAVFDTAKQVGLNVARLKTDMASPEIPEQIIANLNLARALRLFQTPSFIVGTHVLTGPSAEIDFPRAVAAARARKKA